MERQIALLARLQYDNLGRASTTQLRDLSTAGTLLDRTQGMEKRLLTTKDTTNELGLVCTAGKNAATAANHCENVVVVIFLYYRDFQPPLREYAS